MHASKRKLENRKSIELSTHKAYLKISRMWERRAKKKMLRVECLYEKWIKSVIQALFKKGEKTSQINTKQVEARKLERGKLLRKLISGVVP